MDNTIKTFKDALLIKGESDEEFGKRTQYDQPHELAVKKLMILAEVLNEGWKPNWNDPKEMKWVPVFDLDTDEGLVFDGRASGWHSFSLICSRLCFRNRELAEYAGRQFIDLYRAFMIF